jgi:hypothetical protein
MLDPLWKTPGRSQLSSWQAHAGQTSPAHLVQIGGTLVAPESVSSFQAHASQTT